MTPEFDHRIELNGSPASADDLRQLVHTNYGHFSAMQVRDGGVRGLDLHLDRIERATQELFGTAIDRERVREYLRHAVAGSSAPLALRVNIFSRGLNRDRPSQPAPPDILVTVAPASRASIEPLRLKSFRYTRELPQIKHVGTFPLFHYRRTAQQAGYDDAVFVDDSGCISEGSIWNIGFWDGAGVIWPEAPQLAGVSMQLLQAGLARAKIASSVRRISLSDVGRFQSAFFTNAGTAVRLIAAIDDVALAIDRSLEARLQECHDNNLLQPL
jgi:branched-subunit amino acid aminotransferase/4-amino-4-deoxychorismate lyase